LKEGKYIMLKYETMIRKLAAMKAGTELSGGYGSIGTEIELVATIYGKKPTTVSKAVMAIYPVVFRKLAGG
jgi:hypothetical protein